MSFCFAHLTSVLGLLNTELAGCNNFQGTCRHQNVVLRPFLMRLHVLALGKLWSPNVDVARTFLAK